MDKKRTKEVVEFIISFLIEQTGNDFFDKWKERKKVEKVLKDDSENIKRVFFTVSDSDLYNLIEEFIICFAFKDPDFYSPMNLTEGQEEKLWEKFQCYFENENGTKNFEMNKSYREKIVRCINLHNEAINKIIMDDKSSLHIKMMQKQHESIEYSLSRIIDTLNTDTKLQDSDDELNFAVEQIESIMKSYRFDINQLSKIQIFCICGSLLVLLAMAVSVPLSLKNTGSIYAICIMLMFFVVFVIMIFVYWKNIAEKLKRLENSLEKIRNELIDFHSKIYYEMINNKYIRKYDKKNK